MQGRLNKKLKITLLKQCRRGYYLMRYDIVVRKQRSHANSRLDKIGSITTKTSFSIIKLDLKKLTKYLIEKNATLTASLWKALNLDMAAGKYERKKELTKSWSKI